MRDLYFYSEMKFVELSRIIPIQNSWDTHSPELYSQLQFICSQVEGMMKHLCKKFKLGIEEKSNFHKRRSKLDVTDMLSKQKCSLIPISKCINPWMCAEWWNENNSTKHNLPSGITAGNLNNVIHALCGLYLLHHIDRFGNAENVLDSQQWRKADPAMDKIPDNKGYIHTRENPMKSDLFDPYYEFRETDR